MSRADVLTELRALKAKDAPWAAGRVWAGVYDAGAEVSETIKAANNEFLCENALYFNYYPSLLTIENKIVRTVARLLGGTDSAVGNFTSGGTESIMTAVRAARDWARATRGLTGTPRIVAPLTAHAAVHKAAHFLGCEIVTTPFEPGTFRADVRSMEAAITPNTMLLVASAPCYTHGVVDDVPAIAALAKRRGILCHVDACVGGVHLSMMREAGMEVPEFDLSVHGVTSLSVDLHKYGYAAKNASVVLYANKDLRHYGLWSCSKTTSYSVVNTTVLSSRSGGPIAAAWAAMLALGREGYLDIVRSVQAATERMIAGVRTMPELEVLGDPAMCMFTVAIREGVPVTVFDLDAAMMRRGWFLQPIFSAGGGPANLHFSVNRSNVPHVDALLGDLRSALDELISDPVRRDVPTLVASVLAEFQRPGKNLIERLTPILGLSTADNPSDIATASAVLDALPDEVTDAIFVAYLNEIYA
jgi:glutamate/tyrosine decarboxylase-like PLP-dependent enzyme